MGWSSGIFKHAHAFLCSPREHWTYFLESATDASPSRCMRAIPCRFTFTTLSSLTASTACLAHKLYPVRIKVVNDVSEEVTWMTVAYIPIVRKQTETAADDSSHLRRCGTLQRVLYACMRRAIAASHVGAESSCG